MGDVGHLADWPADAAPEDRSCSMKCRVHRGRCALVRQRRRVSDGMLLRWLFEAKIPAADATKEDHEALIEEHGAAWASVIDGGWF